MITTQYVFVEANASEPIAQQFIEQYKITVNGGRGDVKGVYDARVWILGAQYSMAF